MTKNERTIAAAILELEDGRVTGPDTLRVTRLPAADKGGDWEICGICDGIEPEVFNRLKSLLDAGKKEEAWEGCLQYVLDNTDAVRGWMGNDLSHPATELLVRDHYFNAGRTNAARLLQRALNGHGAGLAEDGVVGAKTKAALGEAWSSGMDERNFLMTLTEKRKAYYRSCRQFDAFGKGWLNRCDDAHAAALALIDQGNQPINQ